MGSKLIGGALAAWLLAAATVPLCAASIAAALPGAHDCCDKATGHSCEKKSDCELLCALAGDPFDSSDKVEVERPDSQVAPTHLNLESRPRPVSKTWNFVELRPPDHAPPLFILHAAFLL